ncbi:PseudoU_synth_1 domain-containing protein [Cephalotus follicularis]|uniref:PseudoU_synth_1 domain-containing protein n=1 Tax=Cephalotus follicularis TaxID=3775 RepID=A0A1Q3BSE3_CEPFO|nr:PseudoU_synth_1 domain-containing protein [Cephalotus follicularis]
MYKEVNNNLPHSDAIISNLQSLVDSLHNRVKELEAENAELLSRLSNCHCHKIFEKVKESEETKAGGDKTKKKKILETNSGYNTEALNHQWKRYVALKVMYFGQRFYGFASEAQMDPTVESEIFKALEKTRLLVGDRKESQYSRCGRTDKGVSSVGQVIALFLRSNLKKASADNKNSGKVVLQEQNEGEIDYVRVLNRALPKDIRVIGWCPVPLGFHARFSCLSRQYKYFFWRENLNLLAMESAGKKFVGEHDFRNLCKMDAENVHNYRRRITSLDISPCDMRFEGSQIYAIHIKGSAFLWHQVRCMVAVLFMIGKGLESSDVIDALLDTERTSRKPQYTMAPEIPLVLQSCEFEDLNFTCSSDAGYALRIHLENERQTYQLQAAIFHEAVLNCLPLANDQSSLKNGIVKRKTSHIPLMSRPTEPSYDERRAKLNSRLQS